ncbi:period circadian protein homolog 1 isoform X4 [Gopherus evgoodei]|uniref:period circadian protein homolog 1 isoform X4 n=1 Tax=Gopherus evgoodei TaxID=1825980 RepID=UPI0011CF611F|nr:period circadian protein homolog 1 isoform X4 [Gopherus evgoodei]
MGCTAEGPDQGAVPRYSLRRLRPALSLAPNPAPPHGPGHVPRSSPIMSAGCEPGQAPFEEGSVGGAGSGAPRRARATDDMDATSNGSSGTESHGRDSLGSDRSSNGNGKDSALLETTESSKSTNSQSPSPPSSSIAYSLLSTSSEQDNPSTSGCSSEQSARVKTQKELMKALKEMKIRLPSEKRGKGQSGTLATLQYALSCVKQVQASHDYYQQWAIDESQPCYLDVATYTVAELEGMTSEYTLKNPDTFAVAVSFVTGKILYISDQAAFVLHCKRDVFKGATFAEFLAPQDVSVFYGSTAPYHLPSWSACTSATAAAVDYTQEKSVFCRISGGRGRGRELCYTPFRLTPYLAKVRPAAGAEGQPCCLLIAERIHSGYEAPRIPPDKRVFTTRHTPSCLFQDVDERAAPLLGYLPQDLIGTPVLFYLHPEDRPLMLAIHKKILQCGGQPFDHSPLRFCTRHGEYVTIDTSWSSFVNPWSRKISFVMGRHKVRTGPLNEDVFMAPKALKMRPLEPDIQELSEQIHRLLLQPVHSNGSVGLCSMASNTSHEQFLSAASSSDSNGLLAEETPAQRPMTFQQFCKDVHMVKNQGQQMFIESRSKPPPAKPPTAGLETSQDGEGPGRDAPCEAQRRGPGQVVSSEESGRKEPSSYSYQQINCLDGIIRYLESYNIPSRVKRKCGSSSYTGSSNSDDDKQRAGREAAGSAKDAAEEMLPSRSRREEEEEPAAAVGPALAPLALPSKAESVVSLTSQCSFSSTIVHVGDKKAPESDTAMLEEGPAPPDREQYRRVGLTKEVLSVHTQQEEQAFLTRFQELSRLHVFDAPAGRSRQEGPGAEPGHRGPRRGAGRRGKSKAKRVKQHQTSDSTGSLPPPGPWPPSATSLPFPAVLPVFPPSQPPAEPAPHLPAPLVAPVVALMLPNYVLPPPYFPAPFGEPFGPRLPGPPEASRSTTPERPDSPPFDSRCSSPLQLNLLQMEEAPKAAERQEAPGGQAGGTPGAVELGPQKETGLAEGQDSSNNDALSSSSDLLDLLLQEDSHSGTGSAASGSGSVRSGSNGCSTSASGTTSSKSSHTSKYFGSIDSSEAERARQPPGRVGAGEQFIKYVLQDPLWLLMANTDETVMMTYQLPDRPAAAVLQADREKLREMQKQQPRFTEEQKKELAEVHPWVKKGLLPKAINVMACVDCGSNPASRLAPLYDTEPHAMELSATLEPMEEGSGAPPCLDMAMEEEEAGQPARPEAGAENAG